MTATKTFTKPFTSGPQYPFIRRARRDMTRKRPTVSAPPATRPELTRTNLPPVPVLPPDEPKPVLQPESKAAAPAGEVVMEPEHVITEPPA